MIHGPGVVWSANNDPDNASDVNDDDEDDDDDFVKSPLIPQKGNFSKSSTSPSPTLSLINNNCANNNDGNYYICWLSFGNHDTYRDDLQLDKVWSLFKWKKGTLVQAWEKEVVTLSIFFFGAIWLPMRPGIDIQGAEVQLDSWRG